MTSHPPRLDADAMRRVATIIARFVAPCIPGVSYLELQQLARRLAHALSAANKLPATDAVSPHALAVLKTVAGLTVCRGFESHPRRLVVARAGGPRPGTKRFQAYCGCWACLVAGSTPAKVRKSVILNAPEEPKIGCQPGLIAR